MKSIIFLAMLIIGMASCDTPSTATGSSESQTDTSAVNSMDTSSKMSTTPDTSTLKTDTSTIK